MDMIILGSAVRNSNRLKQLNCLLASAELGRVQSIHKMRYYLTMKENKGDPCILTGKGYL